MREHVRSTAPATQVKKCLKSCTCYTKNQSDLPRVPNLWRLQHPKKTRRDQKSDTARRRERTSTRELSKPSFRVRLPSEGNVFLHRNGQQNGWTRGHEPWINPALTIAAITVRIPYVVRTHFLRKEVFSCARDSLDDSYGAPKSYSNVNHNPSFV